MTETTDLAAAEARAAIARERLNDTVGALQTQLAPKALALHAKEGAKRGGVRALDAATRNPALLAGAATLLIGFLARKRIASAIGDLRGSSGKRRRARKP